MSAHFCETVIEMCIMIDFFLTTMGHLSEYSPCVISINALAICYSTHSSDWLQTRKFTTHNRPTWATWYYRPPPAITVPAFAWDQHVSSSNRYPVHDSASVLFRPPDIVCRRTYILPGFLSFSRQLISELTERNSTIFGHVVESRCNLKMHVRNLGYPIPLQTGGPKTTFLTTSQLNGNFNSLYPRNEIWYKQSGKCLQTTKGFLHCLKTTWTLVHKWLQIGSEFSPTLRKICISLHCQASQTEISKRNSTTLCQTVDGRWR